MKIKINQSKDIAADKNLLLILSSPAELDAYGLKRNETDYIKKAHKNKSDFIWINQFNRFLYIQFVPRSQKGNDLLETMRREASKFRIVLNRDHVKELQISAKKIAEENLLAYLEGIMLSHYTFLKYQSDKEEKENKLEEIKIQSPVLKKDSLERLMITSKAVYIARNLVNEPLSFLNTRQLCEEVKKISKEGGFKLEILGKKQIQSLKMGGLLAVNQGSSSDPAFMTLSWRPESARNKKPVILVGKGIVYDTGGLSLKPTADSMDYMKSDMSGAAAVAAIMYAIALLKLPVYVVGLIPATDNAIGNQAYVPGDVIRMHNKKTVEVLNTDAEGRLILADALSYAIKFKPALVIDIATLTGSAAMAFGHYAMAIMGAAPDKVFSDLEKSSRKTCERMVRLPLYEDYKELLKSDIADIKNIGGRVAGAITAGKFLEYFTEFPWIHMDIAGPAWVNKETHYYSKGGTGFTVRLLVDFIRNFREKE
jgi:leucyl aminopeptidase